MHIVPIGSINLVPKEDMGEDYIVLNEYQYIDKPEEPAEEHLTDKVYCSNCLHFGVIKRCYHQSNIYHNDTPITELTCFYKSCNDLNQDNKCINYKKGKRYRDRND